MKGPGFRLGLDVRRVWKCPACDRVRRTTGDVTALRCHRSKCNHAWMRLLDADHPWPTGLQLDLAARMAEESVGEPEAGTLAPRTAASVEEAIDSVTGTAPRPSVDARPIPESVESENPVAESVPASTEATATPQSPPEQATEPAGESDATDGEAAPKKRKRRRGRRRRKKKPGGDAPG